MYRCPSYHSTEVQYTCHWNCSIIYLPKYVPRRTRVRAGARAGLRASENRPIQTRRKWAFHHAPRTQKGQEMSRCRLPRNYSSARRTYPYSLHLRENMRFGWSSRRAPSESTLVVLARSADFDRNIRTTTVRIDLRNIF